MILVSGGTGMLGAHLIYELLANNEKIRAIKRKTSSLATISKVFSYHSKDYQQLLQKIEWIELDITNTEAVFGAMQDIDDVYHAAAIVSFNNKNSSTIIENNIKATQNMVNAAIANNVRKFCHISSSAALGDAKNGELIDEKSYRNPKKEHSAYSESKYLSELEVWRGINEGLNAVIVNPTIILGEGNWNNGSAGIIKTVAKGLKFYPPGTNGYVDVKDVVDIAMQLMESNISEERFVVSGHNLDYKEIFGKIANALNLQKPNIKARPIMLNIAYRLEAVYAFLSRKEPRITKSSIQSSMKLLKYSSKKLENTLNFKYRPIDDSISRIANNYKS